MRTSGACVARRIFIPCSSLALTGLLLLSLTVAHAEWETRGNVTLQAQVFIEDPIHTADQSENLSLSAESEFFLSFGDASSLTITPFVRIDQHDKERTHFDFRELLYSFAGDDFEFKAGLGKVFWGVAESVNPVDVINQFDVVEGGGSDEKLGQPMINVQLSREWGDLDLYLLPGFRERTFAGEDGRPRLPPIINTEDALYESSAGQSHVDTAFRYTRVLGDWDLGLHGFHGTARDPLFIADQNTGELTPFYYQNNQVGIDAQATLESWLLKAEAIYRSGDAIDDHAELVTGFEYSFYSIAESNIDLGVVSEWLYDERGDDASQPFQNDLLVGLRLALNDEQSTEALFGVIADLDGGGQLLSLEASRRLGDSYRLTVDASIWNNAVHDPSLAAFRHEDFAQIELSYFF
ncbi:MAG: hypothetical protein V3U76_05305 [Granulosicoccus sp.]